MVHAMLTLCERMTNALNSIADNLEANSGFVRDSLPFHVPVLGSLHHYAHTGIVSALDSVAVCTATFQGRCCRWDLTKRTLRLLIECPSGELDEIESKLQVKMPRGRPWRPHAINLGNIEAIAERHRADFLLAVEHAFPIVNSSTFVVSHLAGSLNPPYAVPLSAATSFALKDNSPIKVDAGHPRPVQPGAGPSRAQPTSKCAKAVTISKMPTGKGGGVLAMDVDRGKLIKKTTHGKQQRAAAPPHKTWVRPEGRK